MKTNLIYIILFASVATFGQSVHVNAVTTIPLVPTATDTIKVVTKTSVSSGGFSFGLNYVISQDTIYVDGCFHYNTSPNVPMYYDTVKIGVLPVGNYRIIYTAKTTPNQSDCSSFLTSDSSQHTFQVVVPTFVGSLYKEKLELFSFPNPVTDKLFLQLNNNFTAKATVINMLGQIVVETFFYDGKGEIELARVQSGIYFVIIETKSNSITRKIIKN